MKRHPTKILITLAILLLGWLWYDRFIEDGNFSIVIPGTLYRSATLSHHEWKEIRRENPPFRSVLNLRGFKDHEDWYIRETNLSHQSGINFYTFPLSADIQPSLTEMETLVELMRAAPKPLLVHCKQGADRTGLALALYAYAIQGQPAEQAAKQLSIKWGHFPWLTSKTGAMDKAFQTYTQAHPQTSTPSPTSKGSRATVRSKPTASGFISITSKPPQPTPANQLFPTLACHSSRKIRAVV